MKSIEEISNKRRGIARQFSLGDVVLVKSLIGKLVKWFPGKVIKVVFSFKFFLRMQHCSRCVQAYHLRNVYAVKEKNVQRYRPALPDDVGVEEARSEAGGDNSRTGRNQRSPVCPTIFLDTVTVLDDH